MPVDLPPGQDLAFRWGATASSFVFGIISLSSLMAGLWSLVKQSDDLYGNLQDEDLQCTLASLWICETPNFREVKAENKFIFSYL